mmetsp:Transcript_46439/g.124780  ORF Transcript_46439/g.124780 Transcript_46439/m.124780 type:complete len:202 (+) Transcript_46439:110-715(+)
MSTPTLAAASAMAPATPPRLPPCSERRAAVQSCACCVRGGESPKCTCKRRWALTAASGAPDATSTKALEDTNRSCSSASCRPPGKPRRREAEAQSSSVGARKGARPTRSSVRRWTSNTWSTKRAAEANAGASESSPSPQPFCCREVASTAFSKYFFAESSSPSFSSTHAVASAAPPVRGFSRPSVSLNSLWLSTKLPRARR